MIEVVQQTYIENSNHSNINKKNPRNKTEGLRHAKPESNDVEQKLPKHEHKWILTNDR